MLALIQLECRLFLRWLRRDFVFLGAVSGVLSAGLILCVIAMSMLQGAFFPHRGLARADSTYKVNWLSERRVSRPVPAALITELLKESRGELGFDFAGYSTAREPLLSQKQARWIVVESVSEKYLEILGVRIATGRTFQAGDLTSAESRPAIVSDRLARFLSTSATGAVGQTVRLGPNSFTVIGVASPDFRGLTSFPWFAVDVWVLSSGPPPGGGQRLVVGFSEQRAEADLASLLKRMAGQHGIEGAPQTFQLSRILVHESIDYLLRPILLGFGVALAMVLLVCAFNIAALMFARNASRATVVAVQAALGLRPTAIVAQAMVEALIVSVAATSVALVFTTVVAAFVGRQSFVVFDIHITPVLALDWRIAGVAYGVAVVVMLCAGAWPSLTRAARDPGAISSGNHYGLRLSAFKTRIRLLGIQIAMSSALMSVGICFAQFFQSSLSIDRGYRAKGLHLLETDLSYTHATIDQRLAAVERLRRGVLSAFGESGVLVTHAPFDGSQLSTSVSAVAESAGDAVLRLNYVSPNYFTLLGARLVEGRDFDHFDVADSEAVAIVTQPALSGGIPVEPGRSLYLQNDSSLTLVKVIGVAARINESLSSIEAPQTVFRPIAQAEDITKLKLLFRRGTTQTPITAVEASISSLEPVIRSTPLDRLMQEQLMPWSVASGAFAVLGLASATVSMVGLVGLVLGQVHECARECAIRLALGALPLQVASGLARRLAPSIAFATFSGAILGLVLPLAAGVISATSTASLLMSVLLMATGTAVSILIVATFVAWLQCRREIVKVLHTE